MDLPAADLDQPEQTKKNRLLKFEESFLFGNHIFIFASHNFCDV